MEWNGKCNGKPLKPLSGMERKWNENGMENFNLCQLEWKIRGRRWNGKWNGIISHWISRKEKNWNGNWNGKSSQKLGGMENKWNGKWHGMEWILF